MDNVVIKTGEKPVACIIWMHGLGADANDMAALINELNLTHHMKHICINARNRPVTINNNISMPAWYDIKGLNLTDREDISGLNDSRADIEAMIHAEIESGFKPHQIFLSGFSQGGAMALYTGIHQTTPLGGIIALSAYLPAKDAASYELTPDTPIFLGQGQYDPIVLPSWTDMSKQWLESKGYSNITWRTYLMEHTVCSEELNDLSAWLNPLLDDIHQRGNK